MGMYLSATSQVGYRTFASICEYLNLPKPMVDDENYCAIINEETYNSYQSAATNIMEKYNISPLEVKFMICWATIHATRFDWLVNNDHELTERWNDLVFC